jgi:hypothetical protein
MLLDNHTLHRVNTHNRKSNTYTAMRLNKCNVISYTALSTVPANVTLVAKTILDYYCSSATDFLNTITLGESKRILKYKLNPPHTTAKSDVESICQLLLSIGTITDYYYSNVSNTYAVTLSQRRSTSMRMLYVIAVAQSVQHVPLNDILLNVKLSDRTVDILWLQNHTIHTAYVEPTVTKVQYLLDKIFLKPLTLPYTTVEETLVVDPSILNLLPPSNKVLPITEVYHLPS